MTNKTFDVPNISCGHCVATIEREVNEMAGVSKVRADAGTKTVAVEWEAPATVDSIKSLLAEINYPAVE
jgi:copper ion binding protein